MMVDDKTCESNPDGTPGVPKGGASAREDQQPAADHEADQGAVGPVSAWGAWESRVQNQSSSIPF
jgi:hypothetical protein